MKEFEVKILTAIPLLYYPFAKWFGTVWSCFIIQGVYDYYFCFLGEKNSEGKNTQIKN